MAIKTFDIGNQVLCDMCNADFTNRDDKGGFLFGSKAVCPDCAPQMRRTIKEYGEELYIIAECPADMSFRDWCLQLRGGDNTVRILTGDDFRDVLRRV